MREEELKARVRSEVDAPNFEAIWAYLKQTDGVTEALSGEDHLIEDLIYDANRLAEFHRHTLKSEGYSGASSGPARGSTEASRITPGETELSRYEYERARAESLFYALEARHRADVRTLQDSLSRWPVEPEKAAQSLQEPSERLRILSERLSRLYPWSLEEAGTFVLTGEIPEVPPITGTLKTGRHSEITITVNPYVSADTVRGLYLQIQGHTEGRERRASGRGMAALRFVLEQADADGGMPSWTVLSERWNAAYPKEEYGDRSGLRKVFQRAYDRVIKPIQRRAGKIV